MRQSETGHLGAPIIGYTQPSRRILLAYLAVSFGFLSFGCSGPRAENPKVDPNTLSDEGFTNYVAQLDLVSVDEAYRAMLILADGEDGRKTFDERRTALESRGIARADWNLQPENVIDTGSVAFMICKICQISGGVDMHVFGSWGLGDRRYATRELIYMELLDESVDYQYLRGSELHTLMRKADNLMMEKGIYESEKIDLTDEGDRDEEGNLIVPPPVN